MDSIVQLDRVSAQERTRGNILDTCDLGFEVWDSVDFLLLVLSANVGIETRGHNPDSKVEPKWPR